MKAFFISGPADSIIVLVIWHALAHSFGLYRDEDTTPWWVDLWSWNDFTRIFSFWTTSNSVSVEPSKVELFRPPSESLWARASDELSSCLPSSMLSMTIDDLLESSLSWGSDISALSFLRIAFYWISMHVLWKNAKDHRGIIFSSRCSLFLRNLVATHLLHNTFHDESTPPLLF